jgi:PPK2 family polyphosphate:nucleotide phosphotransferase
VREVLYDGYRVEPGSDFKLSSVDPGDTQDYERKDARKRSRTLLEELSELQERLYAESEQALLVVLQAMDGGGKDSTIRHVFGSINPQGCNVTNFKAPTAEELAHDFLWRVHRRVPPNGYIGVFNRSHYEDVLVPRVHRLVPEWLIEERYEHINAFEKLLHDHGVRMVKIYLHISREYQLQRIRRRLKRPDKLWKFAPEDLAERKHWDAYTEAYETLLNHCSTPRAPWYVIPAQRRWFRNLAIAQLLTDTLQEMNPRFPPPAFDPADFPEHELE